MKRFVVINIALILMLIFAGGIVSAKANDQATWQGSDETSGELIIGFDANLGLPKDFADQTGLRLKGYTNSNLTNMIDDFKNKKTHLIFIPAGTLPYLGSDYRYSVVAQATMGPKRSKYLTSYLVTAEKLTLSDIVKSKLGRVNKYCTTSYWAPLFYIKDNVKDCRTVNFVDTNGFQDMLFKVAERKIDSAMVWDIILADNKDAENKVHDLGVIRGLSGPIIIANTQISDALKNKITNYKTDASPFFNGFATADMASLNNFTEQMQQAIRYFKINLDKN